MHNGVRFFGILEKNATKKRGGKFSVARIRKKSKKMLTDSFNGSIGYEPRAAVRGVHSVYGVFGIGYAYRHSVEHLVKSDKFVAKFKADLVDYFKFLIEHLSHAQFVRRRKKERFEEYDDYSGTFELFDKFGEIDLEFMKIGLRAVFELMESVVYAYHYHDGVGL